MAKKSTTFLIILVLISSICLCQSLRCRTQDGPSSEEVRTVIRTCMKRLNDENIRSGDSRKHKNNDDNNDGGSSDDDDDDNEHDDDDNSEDDDEDYKSDNNNENNRYGKRNNNNHNQRKVNRHFYEYFRRGKMHNQMENTNSQWQNMANNNNNNNNNNHSAINNRMNNTKNTDLNNQSSCLINCFLSQMKMTNRDGLPDKHKVLNVITKHMRDRELNEFYKDSIQECFHIIEISNLKEKCHFSRNLVSCLNDRARANCDDFDNSMIFN